MLTENYDHIKLSYIPDPLDRRDYPIRCYLKQGKINVPSRCIYQHPSPIRDQGSLGASTAFACAALKEWQEFNQRRSIPYRDVSEAWIYWKSKDIDPWGVLTQGTSFRFALKIMQKVGVPIEECWPYRPYNSIEGRGTPKWYSTIMARRGKILTYARVGSIPQMAESIYLHGPLLIGVSCFKGIFSPTNRGVIPMPKDGSRELGSHAMLVTGYDNNLKAFRVRNSWGPRWSTDGYGWLPYAYVDKYLIDAWSVVDG